MISTGHVNLISAKHRIIMDVVLDKMQFAKPDLGGSVVCQEFRECSEHFWGSAAHACISEMECLGVRPCRKNEIILKMVVN